MRLCFIGGGKMAEALIGGLIETGWGDAADIGCVEIAENRRAELATAFPGVRLAPSVDAAVGDASFDLGDVLLAVKPQHIATVARSLGAAGTKRALSIAAGITLDALVTAFDNDARIIRAMPNTPALVGCGAAAIAGSVNADDGDLGWAESILAAVGTVTRVDERALDAVTGLSGSGPAYVFLLAEAMRAGGIAQGLAPDIADALTRQTLLGAATLLASSADDPATLRANVTSPGGTTAAAIAEMQSRQLESIVAAGIAAATARSIELGAAN